MLALGCILASALPATSQKKNFTITEATNGIHTTLAPKSIRQASWQPGTDAFFFTVNEKWIRVHAGSGKTDTITSLATLNSMHQSGDSLKRFPGINWINASEAYYQSGNQIRFLNFSGNHLQAGRQLSLPESGNNITLNKKGNLVAYTVDNNLMIADASGHHQAVTNDSNLNVLNGRSVHRDEFGIHKGIFFSPEGNLLAYYRMDQSMVKDYPVINWAQTPAKADMIKYPMAGDTSHHVTVAVYNPATQKTITLQTGTPADQYLTCVSWSPDEKYIFIAVLNRAQDHLRLNQYDVQTGAYVRTLFEEKSDKYVEPQHELTFLPGSNDQFIWWSQRDGYMHLYLYRTNGQLIRQLTKGNWVVNELTAFNPKKKEIIYTSSQVSPLEKHSYAVNWTNGKTRRINTEPGVHNVLASHDGQYVFDVYNNSNTPRASVLRSTDGRRSHVLVNASDPLSEYNRPEVRNVTLFAVDSTPLYGKVILPIDFDSTKKYPVIVYLYNGPHAQLIRNQFPASGNLWYEYMAQKGYLVFSMDGRGSENRGLAFEQAIHRRAGDVELEDQLKGVAYLASLGYADTSRMGIHGWSYGGFMTTSMMLRHPGVFKAGVAGGPVTDWRMYEVMYTERYMGTPQNNPEGYKKSALGDKVQNLQGKLLLIHGTDDDVVVWQHSIELLKKFVDAGVQVDYFAYPGHPHNVRGKDRVHLMQQVSDYFDLHLK